MSLFFYGGGNFSGFEVIDQVTIGPDLVIHEQSMGVALKAAGFNGVDGILGIGPVNLTNSTLTPDNTSIIPTVTDNLFSTHLIQKHLVSVFFAPITNASGEQNNGELTWGQVNTKNFVGSITYTPVTHDYPANKWWGINTSINYGATSLLSDVSGIVDTGTSLILMVNDAFEAYQKATGATLDQNTGLLTINSNQYNQLHNLGILVSDVVFELAPNAQIWPRILNVEIGGVAGKIYLIVSNFAGVNAGIQLPGSFVLGMPFLERFYSVYDTTNQRVGFAKTRFTDATSN